jgi:hypothetical protein
MIANALMEAGFVTGSRLGGGSCVGGVFALGGDEEVRGFPPFPQRAREWASGSRWHIVEKTASEQIPPPIPIAPEINDAGLDFCQGADF